MINIGQPELVASCCYFNYNIHTEKERERERVAQHGPTPTCANGCLVLVSLIDMSACYCVFYSEMACIGTQDNKR